MTCPNGADLVAMVKRELPEAELAKTAAHVGSCTACTAEATRVESVLSSFKALEPVGASAGFNRRVRDAFVQAHPEFVPAVPRPGIFERLKDRLLGTPGWSVALALQVILIGVAAILFINPRGPLEPTDIQGDPNRSVNQSPAGTIGSRRTDETEKFITKWVESTRIAGYLPTRAARKRAMATESNVRETSIRKALAWLVDRQDASGKWDTVTLGGDDSIAVGITSLATLAFLADGHSPLDGEFAPTVRKSVAWIQDQQKASGLFGSPKGRALYNHAVASLVMLETWLMTKDDAFKPSVRAALMYAIKAQNASGGWESPDGATAFDTSVGGWMVLLLRMAFESGETYVAPALNAARDQVMSVTDAQGRTGYRTKLNFPNGPGVATAVGMVSNVLSTQAPDVSLLGRQASVLVDELKNLSIDATAPANRDMIFWHFGSIALHQAGQVEWEPWSQSMRDGLIKAQAVDGSWGKSFDRWSTIGGPAYATAMGALILSSDWRYPRLSR